MDCTVSSSTVFIWKLRFLTFISRFFFVRFSKNCTVLFEIFLAALHYPSNVCIDSFILPIYSLYPSDIFPVIYKFPLSYPVILLLSFQLCIPFILPKHSLYPTYIFPLSYLYIPFILPNTYIFSLS